MTIANVISARTNEREERDVGEEKKIFPTKNHFENVKKETNV